MDIQAAFKVTASVAGQQQIDALVNSLKKTGDTSGTSAKQIDALNAVLKDAAGQAKFTDTQLAALTDAIKTVSPAARLSSRELSELNDRIRAAGVQAGLSPKQMDTLSASIRKVGGASEISAAQTTQAFRQLPVQLTDVVTQLAGGQSPFLILLQQGGQVKDSFGGIGNTMKALGSIMTPLRVVGFGLAAALGAIALAAYQGADETGRLNKAIALTGDFAGKSIGQLNAMAVAVSKVSGGTIGNARDLVGGAVASGAFGPDVIQPAVEAMGRIQQLSGQTADELVKDFAQMSRGVASWAAEHNRQYNYLTLEQYKYIKSLEEQGRVEEAMRVNAELLNAEFSKRTADLGYLEIAWKSVKSAASSAWDSMLNIGRTITLEDQLKDAEAKIASARRSFQQKQAPNRAFAEMFGLDYKPGQIENDPAFKALMADADRLYSAIQAKAAASNAAAKKQADEQQQILNDSNGTNLRLATAGSALALQQAKNASDARVALLDAEQARLDGMKNAGLISDSDYSKKKLDIQRRELAEKVKLVDAEIEIERRRPTGDRVDSANQQTRLAALAGERARAAAALRNVEITAGFGVQDNNFKTAIEGFKEAAAAADFQAEAIKRLGQAVNAGKQAQAEYDVELGKFKNLSAEQKKAIIEAAKEADKAADGLRQAQGGLDYTKQTRLIEAQTRALGESNLEKQITIALQELENKGITKGSELYNKLAADRMSALTKANDAQRTFNLGAKQAFQEYIEDAGNAAKGAQALFSNAFKGLEDALVQFAQTGKFSFKEFANAIIADIIRIQARMAIAGLAKLALSAFGGPAAAGTSALGDFNAGGIGGVVSAKGNAFNGGQLTAFANGGAFTNTIATQPTVAPLALFGEAGPEAIMPLARDSSGRLGVRSQGGGGAGVTVNVVINAETGEKSESASGGESAKLAQFGSLIAGVVRQQLINEKRPGGLLSGV